MRVLAVLISLPRDSFAKAADSESADYRAGAWTLWDPTLLRAVGVVWALIGAASSVVGVVIDVALLAVAARAGGLSCAGAQR